jgi:hypothetical protein
MYILAVSTTAASAWAGSVRIVERPNVPPFVTIQAAVDGALAGETLLVSGGAYAGFSISAKPLAVISDNSSPVTVNGLVTISSLPNAETVLLSGLVINGPTVSSGSAPPGVRLSNNAGHVRLEACAITGGFFGHDEDHRGGAGAQITACWGPGNLSVDPLFADPDGADNNPATFGDNDYTLAIASPCIDAGDNNLIAADFLDIDGDGNVSEPTPLDLLLNPRRVDVPSAPITGNGTSPLVDIGSYERS